jgi:hypothetical protein
MKLLKDTAAQCNVNNLIISGSYDSLPKNQISRKTGYVYVASAFALSHHYRAVLA